MATLSVLSYNLSQGSLKMKSQENNVSSSSHNNSLAKTFNKITVQNVLSENKSNALNISNNNANAIVKKIKDFGMIGAVNAVNSGSGNGNGNMSPILLNGSRKRPLTESKLSSNILIKPVTPTAAAKKPKLNQKAAVTSTPKNLSKKSSESVNQNQLATNIASTAEAAPTTPTAGTPGRKGLPLPQAVARRNARERNRVKQVNNGFAALRERIPEEVAEAFEAQSGGGRAALSKKLSKVETLRMAVEYIRSLERLLGFDFPIGGNQSTAASFALIKDEFGALSPGLDEQYDDSLSNYELDEDFVASQTQQADSNIENSCLQSNLEQSHTTLDMLPNITTLNGLQYIRIPGTNTYQLLTAEIFAGNSPSPTTSHYEDERYTNIIDTNCQSPHAAATATNTADTYASPTTSMATTAGPTLITQTTAPARHQENGDHVKLGHATSSSSLSRSPVPLTTSSPSALQPSETAITTTPTLSPVGNELLLQTCADNDVVLAAIANHDRLSIAPKRQFVATVPQQQQQQQLLPARMIKQEFIETDFTISTEQQHSPNNIYQTIMHNQQQLAQQQLLLGQTSMSMSPPLDRLQNVSRGVVSKVPASVLPGYFEQDHNASFYDGVVTFKKELSDVMLDTSNATAALSDESMMEAIDWWEAHTPKSDGGSVIM